ncbi:hypothetical protein GCM10020000_80800 [Streptomyces olivoverticillatus]
MEAREAAARVRFEALEAELAELPGRLEEARSGLERLRIMRETVADVLAQMTPELIVGGRRWRWRRQPVTGSRRRMRGLSGGLGYLRGQQRGAPAERALANAEAHVMVCTLGGLRHRI